MILFFKMWCENIIVGIVLTLIIEMISPNRFIKFIKVITGIFIMYLVISPIIKNISLFSPELVLKEIEVSSDKLLQEDIKNDSRGFDDMNFIFIEGMKINIKNRLDENGYFDYEIDLELNEETMEIKSVIVNKNSNLEESDSNDKKIIEIIKKEIDIEESLIIFK